MICLSCREGARLLVRLENQINGARMDIPSEMFRRRVKAIDVEHALCTGCCCGHRLDTRLHKTDVAMARQAVAV